MSALLQAQRCWPQSVHGREPVSLADIYQPTVNLVRWQRRLKSAITADCAALLSRTALSLRSVLKPGETIEWLPGALNLPPHSALLDDVSMLVTLFADLFGLEQVGLRFELIDKTMCPRFHTDRLTCRLVTTYSGAATQWLEESNVDRSKLGPGAAGLADELSGIVRDARQIHHAAAGEVLLLKGDGWPDTAVPGIVHRSPPSDGVQKRLLLTLDLV